jgi:dihydroorotase-like cyclic amidohydrolase
MTIEEREESIKKILCCSSLIKDLLTAKLVNPPKMDDALSSKEAAEFIKAADQFAKRLQE